MELYFIQNHTIIYNNENYTFKITLPFELINNKEIENFENYCKYFCEERINLSNHILEININMVDSVFEYMFIYTKLVF